LLDQNMMSQNYLPRISTRVIFIILRMKKIGLKREEKLRDVSITAHLSTLVALLLVAQCD